jgi:hypothetical protein
LSFVNLHLINLNTVPKYEFTNKYPNRVALATKKHFSTVKLYLAVGRHAHGYFGIVGSTTSLPPNPKQKNPRNFVYSYC